MVLRYTTLITVCLILLSRAAIAADEPELQSLLTKPIIGAELSQDEVMEFTDARVMPMPEVETIAQWEAFVRRQRQATFAEVIYRGSAAQWRDAELGVEYLDTIDGGPGYSIRKLRYEAVPGLWIPALLYVPDNLTGKVPVIMNVNGHDGNGKAAPYKQIRCINQAKRGMIALNVEWFGMGQLRTDNFAHYRLNQIDLCGTSGYGAFYLSMKRALDVLLSHEHADPERVAVTGLSGGGCQTIQISALDERVTLADPVAGYSSFHTRARYLSDLGDSEQTPVDLAVTADYSVLTAMRAPRPTLLTYNDQDNCCFRAGHALPPLVQAAEPIFKLYGKPDNLHSHINTDPGTHNYELDNRQQLYAFLGRHFHPDDAAYDATEIPCEDEVLSADELMVPLPNNNLDLHALAVAEMQSLPRDGVLPTSAGAAAGWQRTKRARLRQVLRFPKYDVQAKAVGQQEVAATQATFWQLKIGDAWTVPAVELVRGTPQKTVVLIGDEGRGSLAPQVEELLAANHRVIAVDPFFFGESKIKNRDFLFALLVSAVGERPLGIQASQVAAVARWAAAKDNVRRVKVIAVGHRTSVVALAAAALSDSVISGVELHDSLGSLRQVVEENRQVIESPELFCFGLLVEHDIKQLAALVAPNTVKFVKPSERVRSELADLKAFYAELGIQFDPFR
ncbi:Acetyl xylan esterase (AXE1) [Symmachiella dynata]|uniref:Acetyl xylan esterase (AXE1) n=1 Tax=Symmachiella dynata TaxID=2527995 RepID=A0A517ZNM7_9PLAN|nr:acetylxylan esterase [Symmachiella dynata]QDU44085.1 Acetyl xylan esterase (AXE1) [Symmachiella dynata]